MKPKIVIICWRDAHYSTAEVPIEEATNRHKSAIYWSAGVLVRSDETGVTFAQDFGLPVEANDSPGFRSRSFIPRELIEAEISAGYLIRKPTKKKKEQIDGNNSGNTEA